MRIDLVITSKDSCMTLRMCKVLSHNWGFGGAILLDTTLFGYKPRISNRFLIRYNLYTDASTIGNVQPN